MKLRIALVTPELHRTGGTERGTAELATRMARQHHVCLFAHQWEQADFPAVCYHRVPVVPWPGLARFFSFFLAASRQVRQAEQQHGVFDAVYSPGPNCRQVDVSTAWFCQARQLEILKSGRLRPRPVRLEDWLQLIHRRAYAALVTRLERRFYGSQKLKWVVSPAEVLKRDLVECYGMDEDRILVAHSGVNLREFDPALRKSLRPRARAELGLREGEFYFLFVGTDWVRKGMLAILEAMRKVPEANLLAVGPYNPEAYHRCAAQLGVAVRVRYLPRREDILYYYAAADALLAPSVYEPFGLIPMEAMACGLPTIITRAMGVAEVVTEQDALILSDAESTAELAQAMQQMLEQPELRSQLASSAMQRARQNSWDKMCEATLGALLETARVSAAARDTAK